LAAEAIVARRVIAERRIFLIVRIYILNNYNFVLKILFIILICTGREIKSLIILHQTNA